MDLDDTEFEAAGTSERAERVRTRRTSRESAAAHRLARAIESEIIPRLLLVHGVPVGATPAQGDRMVTADDNAAGSDSLVDELAQRCIGGDASRVWDLVSEQAARGMSIDAIELDLLAPAARRLGDLWLEDRCDFTQVTVGLTRLRQTLRRLAPDTDVLDPQIVEPQGRDRRVLLAPLPGEQHTFGLLLVADFLRRDGWQVHEPIGATLDDLVALVRRDDFAIVGLSAGSSDNLEPMTAAIAALRRAAVKRPVGVLVGGAAFSGKPDCALRVGADATVADASAVSACAERLIGLLRARV
jgi:methanogenic corrinoid protein MtbC1